MAIILISDSLDTDEAVRLSDITTEENKIYATSTIAVATVTASDLRYALESQLNGKDLEKLKSLSDEQIFSIMHDIGDSGFGTNYTEKMEQAGIDELAYSWTDNVKMWEELKNEEEE